MGVIRIIELEDKGQDFTELHVNDSNIIVDAYPFQGWVWKGMRIQPEPIRAGMKLKLFKDGHSKGILRYAVIGVKEIKDNA